MGNLRPRHNVKGRLTKRPAKERNRPSTQQPAPATASEAWLDDGFDAIMPTTAAKAKGKGKALDGVDEEEKQRMRTELLANGPNYDVEEKMSKKKRKRLDAYIERKLKKERRGELLKELEWVAECSIVSSSSGAEAVRPDPQTIASDRPRSARVRFDCFHDFGTTPFTCISNRWTDQPESVIVSDTAAGARPTRRRREQEKGPGTRHLEDQAWRRTPHRRVGRQ